MRTILVINSKGGCGKTTVTTNLASYYATAGARVAISDHDPQGSSLQWLRMRPARLARIHGANGTAPKAHLLRTLQTWIPTDTEIELLDAPGAVKGLVLQDVVAKSDSIVIPVAPSAIDVHATADFLKNLLLLGRVRARNIKVAVVANRVRSSMPVYAPLERFLKSLSLPFLTRITDADAYISAAEQGVGIFDMDAEATAAQRQEFLPIVRWLDCKFAAQASATDSSAPEASAIESNATESNVVDLTLARRQALAV
jgi:chromosome partitioning protein